MRERVKDRGKVRDSKYLPIFPQVASLDTSQMDDYQYQSYITWIREYQRQLREYADSLPSSVEDKKERKAIEKQVRDTYKALIVEDCRVFNPVALHTLEQTRKVLQLEKKQFNTIYNELLKERQTARLEAQAAM